MEVTIVSFFPPHKLLWCYQSLKLNKLCFCNVSEAIIVSHLSSGVKYKKLVNLVEHLLFPLCQWGGLPAFHSKIKDIIKLGGECEVPKEMPSLGTSHSLPVYQFGLELELVENNETKPYTKECEIINLLQITN